MQLVINNPGTILTQKDECFRPKKQERTLDVSLLKMESIVMSNTAMISSQPLMRGALKYGSKQMVVAVTSWDKRISWFKYLSIETLLSSFDPLSPAVAASAAEDVMALRIKDMLK
jgi:hypothetical protein